MVGSSGMCRKADGGGDKPDEKEDETVVVEEDGEGKDRNSPTEPDSTPQDVTPVDSKTADAFPGTPSLRTANGTALAADVGKTAVAILTLSAAPPSFASRLATVVFSVLSAAAVEFICWR